MAKNLPQELIDLIVGDFQTLDDPTGIARRTVAQCGLVCKRWLPVSRNRLFANVDLHDRNMGPFLSIVKTCPFPIPMFIRTLGLSSRREDKSLEESLRTLGPLPQLTTLRVAMDHAVFALNSALLAQRFASISKLVLNNCELRLNAVMDAVSSFRGLESLGIHRVELYGTFRPGPAYKFPPQCRTLSVHLSPDRTVQIFRTILSLSKIPVFSSLSIYGMDSRTGTSFEQYLCHVGDRIHHLRLESDHYLFPAFPGGLCHSTGLRCLDLVFEHDGDIPDGVLRTLPHLRSSDLTLNLLDNYGTKFACSQWELLDQALAGEGVAHPGTIVVRTASSTLVAELPKCMPKALARGILQVVDESE
ncbi:hypothetical protein B0H17DRAFT_317868 [Mycena rosella]|uniref:F-box domain-containing protein n=1 Tax=Mycena rosella TaxID=1033263 RepID=A0AAD7GNC1_MYCRO|nr:hypothetical protein B0H17DRAFT_317868 [Mycena rosella]